MPGASRKGARLLHDAFEASLLLKGVLAGIEAISGILLFFLPGERIIGWVRLLTTHELTQDPQDLLASRILRALDGYSLATQDFYAVYLLGHGVMKLVVVLLLARGYLWAYPFAVAVLSAFIAYQVHRYLIAPSWGLVVLTVLDLVVIVLTVIEYRARRAAVQARLAPAGESDSD